MKPGLDDSNPAVFIKSVALYSHFKPFREQVDTQPAACAQKKPDYEMENKLWSSADLWHEFCFETLLRPCWLQPPGGVSQPGIKDRSADVMTLFSPALSRLSALT